MQKPRRWLSIPHLLRFEGNFEEAYKTIPYKSDASFQIFTLWSLQVREKNIFGGAAECIRIGWKEGKI